jgi:hypothetical protein
MRKPKLTRTVVVLLLTVLFAACGGKSSKSASGSGAPEEFGLSLAQLAARVENTEKAIADCMSKAGFAYVALDFNTVKHAMDNSAKAPGVSDEAYVKQFGLGITTQPTSPLVAFGAGPQNETTLKGLPKSDQVAYRRALWGEATEWNHARALEAEDLSQTAGCTRAAAEKNYSPGELAATYVNPSDTRIEQDPRMIAALKKWSDCVRSDGFQYDHPDQIDKDLRERLAAIVQGRDPKALTGAALDSLRQLQGEELSIAAAHKKCEDKFIVPVQTKIEAELYGGSPT